MDKARKQVMLGQCPKPLDSDRDSTTNLRFILTPRQFLLQATGILIWGASLAFLWVWWLQPEHNIDTPRFIVVSLVLAWVTLLPLYPVLIVIWGKKVVGPVCLPDSSRVAMVVTRAPSEPFWVARRTLEAMLAQDYPHDTWLADEAPTAETVAWCRENGVKISTRQGVADYHRQSWPRRTRCKEGNLAYFYDFYGYGNYDFVVQMDADQVPDPTYLREMLKPFSDPKIGYVSAPSICDANANSSWAARGRLNVEGTLHGALQAGYNAGWAPLCIGSHYAVRTAALKQIGGLGPGLAEDHSTTLMMNAHGWRGVHAVDAIAHGDGPNTFADLVTQEFQWSRSLVSILLNCTPQYFWKLPPRLRFQFIFCQLWYPMFAVFMAIIYAMPIYALLIGERIVGIGFIDFVLHSAPVSIVLAVLVSSWRKNGWFRPRDARMISWEGVLFLFARWPWVLAGSLAAVKDYFTGRFIDYRITPKASTDTAESVPARVLVPYMCLAFGSLLPVLTLDDVGTANGFYIFALVNTFVYFALIATIVLRRRRKQGLRWSFADPSWSVYAATLVLAVMLPSTPIIDRMAKGVDALTWKSSWLNFTEGRYPVSGAGRHGARQTKMRFRFNWDRED